MIRALEASLPLQPKGVVDGDPNPVDPAIEPNPEVGAGADESDPNPVATV